MLLTAPVSVVAPSAPVGAAEAAAAAAILRLPAAAGRPVAGAACAPAGAGPVAVALPLWGRHQQVCRRMLVQQLRWQLLHPERDGAEEKNWQLHAGDAPLTDAAVSAAAAGPDTCDTSKCSKEHAARSSGKRTSFTAQALSSAARGSFTHPSMSSADSGGCKDAL